MRLNNYQKRFFKMFLRFEKPLPNSWVLIKSQLRPLLIRSMFFLIAALLLYKNQDMLGFGIFIGAFAISLASEITRIWSLKDTWPIYSKIVDWDKLKKLMESK